MLFRSSNLYNLSITSYAKFLVDPLKTFPQIKVPIPPKPRKNEVGHKIIQLETTAGDPIYLGKIKAIPFAKSLRVTLPGSIGGFIWNRPISLLLDRGNGEEQVVPLVDFTRVAQLTLLGAGLIGSLFIYLFTRTLIQKRRAIHDRRS